MINLLTSKAFSLLHVILLFLVVDSGCTQRKYDNNAIEARFKSWMQRHDRHYKDKGEWMLRFGIYQANLNFIDYVNSQNLSYKLGNNVFADLTNEEFKALYVGRLIVPRLSGHIHNSTLPKPGLEQLAPAPKAVDWRKKGAVNTVDCTVDSIVSKIREHVEVAGHSQQLAGGVESLIHIKTGKMVSLSEQELLDCAPGNMGCKGGYKNKAFDYIKSKGISTEKEYPYKGTQATCKAPAKKSAKISGFKTVVANSEAALMEAVALQPVSVSVEGSGKEFQLYKSGIFKGNCGKKVDHELIIVGYGEETSLKYWIFKNSWGTKWGEAGFMRILRGGGGANGKGTCGLAMFPSYPVA